jgi:predicted transcriptional regulator
MAATLTIHPDGEARGAETVTDPERVQTLMDLLTDVDCRGMLAATTGESLTVRELATEADLALSTTYRKVDLLTEVGLLVEQTRFDSEGSHPSEYRRAVDDVVVSVTADDGARLTVTSRSNTESSLVSEP